MFVLRVNLTDLVTSSSTCLLCLFRLLSQLWLDEMVDAVLLVMLVEAELSVVFDAGQSVCSGVSSQVGAVG